MSALIHLINVLDVRLWFQIGNFQTQATHSCQDFLLNYPEWIPESFIDGKSITVYQVITWTDVDQVPWRRVAAVEAGDC